MAVLARAEGVNGDWLALDQRAHTLGDLAMLGMHAFASQGLADQVIALPDGR